MIAGCWLQSKKTETNNQLQVQCVGNMLQFSLHQQNKSTRFTTAYISVILYFGNCKPSGLGDDCVALTPGGTRANPI